MAEPSWPPPEMPAARLFLTDDGLRPDGAPLAARAVCSPQTVGKHAGELVSVRPCARIRPAISATDDARSLVFETPPLDAAIEILGAPVVTLESRPTGRSRTCAVRLCDVHPSASRCA